MTARHIALLASVACAAAGCQDPYRERSAVVPTAPRRTAAPSSSTDTATAFAKSWINWDWNTLPHQQRALARLAGGRLATGLRADADAAASDETLARDQPANRGTVAAISLNPSPGSARGLVVTRERTYTNGHADLGGARYRVYRVAISASHDGWTVTEWAPQP
jgi:hypothetical protein